MSWTMNIEWNKYVIMKNINGLQQIYEMQKA